MQSPNSKLSIFKTIVDMFNLKYKDESKIELFCNETKKRA